MLGAPAACAPTSKAPTPDAVEEACLVDARAPWDGDASAIRVGPDEAHASVRSAINAASSGDTILLAPGTYDADIETSLDDLTIVGACPEAVRWGTEDGIGPLWIYGNRVHVEGITFVGGPIFALYVWGDDALLVDVHTVESSGWGLSVYGARAEARGLDVSGNRCYATGTNICTAVIVSIGSLTVSGGNVHDNDGFGLYLNEGARVDLTGVTIQDIHAAESVGDAVAIRVDGDSDSPTAFLSLHDGTVLRDMEGPAVSAAYATITSDGNVEIADNTPRYAGGYAFWAQYGSVDLSAGFVVRSAGSGAIGLGSVERASLDGVVIEDACALFPDQVAAILAVTVPSLTLADVTVTDSSCGGIYTNSSAVTGSGGSVTGSQGYGIMVVGGTAALTGMSVTDTADGDYLGTGVLAYQVTDAVLTEMRVADNHGYGVAARESTVRITGLEASGNGGAGIVLVASVATVSSPLITGTLPIAELAWGGYGIYAARADAELEEGASYTVPEHDGAELTISSGQISGTEGAGLMIRGGVTAEVSGLGVGGTLAGNAGGDAVVVAAGSTADLAEVTTTGGVRASILYSEASGSVADSHGEEAAGLVQQGCDGVDPVEASGRDAAAFAGGVHLCEPGWVDLPVAAAALPWTTEVDLDP